MKIVKNKSIDDRAAKEAEELLNSFCRLYPPTQDELTAVAAKLRDLYTEIERLRNDLSDALDVKIGNGPTVLSDLKAEIARLRDEATEWKNAHQLELEQHIKAAKEVNRLRAELAKVKP